MSELKEKSIIEQPDMGCDFIGDECDYLFREVVQQSRLRPYRCREEARAANHVLIRLAKKIFGKDIEKM